jgi:predicted nucleic acid-binding protein
MTVYADTNFFTAAWVDIQYTSEAEVLFAGLRQHGGHLPVTRLLRIEFTNALQRLVFEARNGSQELRATPENALVARASFDEEVSSGDFLRWTVVSGDALEQSFETLAYRHTAREGFRTYDILHVACALLLGCDTFWSFDKKARRLAELEGLQTN